MNLANLFPQLRESLRPAKYPDGVTPKGRFDLEGKKKTQKGAYHIQGRHFLGRQIFAVTPAQYRHMHMGLTKKV